MQNLILKGTQAQQLQHPSQPTTSWKLHLPALQQKVRFTCKNSILLHNLVEFVCIFFNEKIQNILKEDALDIADEIKFADLSL